jgi:hypothetical protein
VSGLVKVERELKFNANPLRMGPEAVVDGRFNEAMVHGGDDFLVDTLNGDLYASSVGNGGVAPAIVVGANGLAAIAVNASDNDVAEWYGEANWYAAQGAVFECRFKVNAITTVAYNVGLMAVACATNDKISLMVGGSNAVELGANVTDIAAFVFDTDADTDVIYCVSSKNGAAAQKVATALAPVADTFEVVSIHLDSSGNARFFRNGVAVGFIAAAVTATVGLRPYFALKGNSTTGRTLTVDYWQCWQNRRESAAVVW